MKKSNTFERLLKYASMRLRSTKELTDWMTKRKIEKNDQKILLAKLTEYKLVDDREFAGFWVRYKMLGSSSQKKVMMELTQKGIPKDVAHDALESEGFNDTDQAKKALKKASKRLMRSENSKEKALAYLARKGFSYSICERVIDSLET